MVSQRRRSGRRPGGADTRGEILAAARRTFAEKGFDKATIRGIAREAGVDPALVHHYFATKEGVFAAAMQMPVEPANVVPQIIEGPREQVGERLVRVLLGMTADGEVRDAMVGLLRTAMTNDQAITMVREFITRAILGRVVEALDVPPLRMEAAFAQMAGLIIARHILRLEPLASAEVDELVELVAPTIQRYLVG